MSHTVASLLLEAAYLMAVGMFVVFLFLGSLIGAMNIVAWINKRFPDVSSHQHQRSQGLPLNPQLSAGLVAAITAAVHQHRNK